MIITGNVVTHEIRDELVYKVIVDLLKDREKEVRHALRRHVNSNGITQLMSTNDWVEVENRVMIAFVAIRGYVPQLGRER